MSDVVQENRLTKLRWKHKHEQGRKILGAMVGGTLSD